MLNQEQQDWHTSGDISAHDVLEALYYMIGYSKLSQWERGFCESTADQIDRLGKPISSKQFDVILRLCKRFKIIIEGLD